MELEELDVGSIRGVQFRERLRGYHPDDVDEFIERIAVVFEELNTRLEAALNGEAGSAREETIRRLLVMAQRTADLAIAEGESTAQRVLQQADAKAQQKVDEAEARAQVAFEKSVAKLKDEIALLEIAKAELEVEQAAMQARVNDRRARLRAELTDELKSLDHEWAPAVDVRADPAHDAPAEEDRITVGDGEPSDPFMDELRRAVEGPDPWDLDACHDDGDRPAVTAPELRGIPEGGRLTGRFFRRR